MCLFFSLATLMESHWPRCPLAFFTWAFFLITPHVLTVVVLHFTNLLPGFRPITSHGLEHLPCTISFSSQASLEVGMLAQRLCALKTSMEIDKCPSKKIIADLLPQKDPGEVNCMEWHGWTNILERSLSPSFTKYLLGATSLLLASHCSPP